MRWWRRRKRKIIKVLINFGSNGTSSIGNVNEKGTTLADTAINHLHRCQYKIDDKINIHLSNRTQANGTARHGTARLNSSTRLSFFNMRFEFRAPEMPVWHFSAGSNNKRHNFISQFGQCIDAVSVNDGRLVYGSRFGHNKSCHTSCMGQYTHTLH